jgi:EAL domain-containing protein (putative c-di-GMP-specific phosphodiesterase class I)
MLEIGRALDLEVVPEGIETPEQPRILSELGCPLGQGFLFARPVSATRRARGRPRARARRGSCAEAAEPATTLPT